MRSIHLVNPRADFPTYYGSDVFAGRGYAPAAFVADLAVATVAAMVPPDFHVSLVDENVSPVDFDTDAECVGITGKVSQWGRMQAIAAEFRRRGKLVLIGGPFASLSPETVRPHCDVLVVGEADELAEELFAHLREGRPRDEYRGGKPDLDRTPVPRWDLYPNDRAILASVQTSRGCPFECEFCDVIQYLGRRQRHKPVDRVLAELDVVYRHGYRAVFLCDDNLTVYRARARELLVALRDWNAGQTEGKVEFITQVSIDVARDEELLRLCAEAGLTRCFVGIETVNQDSLRETKKRQNVNVDAVASVRRFLDSGIQVMAGMIVGFDHDDAGTFARQYDFAMASGIPMFSIGTLMAPPSTPLHARLAREGRLLDGTEVGATPWSTNVVPAGMTHDELIEGMRWLCNGLYSPAAFGERVVQFIDRLGPRRDPRARDQLRPMRPVELDLVDLVARLPSMGPDEAAMWWRISKAFGRRREAAELALSALVQYMQVRYMLELGSFWEPRLRAAS
jgi:radical SAM superfamily enzyme YgiQ (UPF0313 family)